ncbi:hypothetical protein [Streptomyces sp. x-19]|uniref:hypothetical protein n=1 Tax=Streptomyces sp. x-19 TaxID=2789280 RepID=UPI00397F9785
MPLITESEEWSGCRRAHCGGTRRRARARKPGAPRAPGFPRAGGLADRSAGWRSDAPLSLSIGNRDGVVPGDGRPAEGGSVTWSGDAGKGSVTFFDNGGRFEGTAQFPDEGPVATGARSRTDPAPRATHRAQAAGLGPNCAAGEGNCRCASLRGATARPNGP